MFALLSKSFYFSCYRLSSPPPAINPCLLVKLLILFSERKKKIDSMSLCETSLWTCQRQVTLWQVWSEEKESDITWWDVSKCNYWVNMWKLYHYWYQYSFWKIEPKYYFLVPIQATHFFFKSLMNKGIFSVYPSQKSSAHWIQRWFAILVWRWEEGRAGWHLFQRDLSFCKKQPASLDSIMFWWSKRLPMEVHALS